jgi:hypothetical protein
MSFEQCILPRNAKGFVEDELTDIRLLEIKEYLDLTKAAFPRNFIPISTFYIQW